MTLPPSRLLIGLWQIRLLQHRLRSSTCWRSAVSSSFRSSVVSSASVASHAALLSGQGLAVCGECSFGLESNWSVLVSGNGSGWGLVSLAAGEDAVSGSSSSGDSEISYSVIGTSSDAPVTAPWASVDGLGADGFSVISLRRDELKHSCSKWPPRRWQSSFTMTSQSPSSSTSKFRCGSGSRLIRTWGTSWGMEPSERHAFTKQISFHYMTLEHKSSHK